MKTALKYSFGAIALYLLVANGSNALDVEKGASTGGVNLVKAFQGR